VLIIVAGLIGGLFFLSTLPKRQPTQTIGLPSGGDAQ
jgi:hypothetical protein